MNVVVGDATGQIKIVSLRVDGPITKLGTQDPTRGGITSMAWAGLQNRESEVAIALSKGTVEVWDMINKEKVAHMQGLNLAKKDDKYTGLHILRHGAGVENRDNITRRMVTSTNYGYISIAPWLPLLPDLDEDEDLLLAETMSSAQIQIFKKKRMQERTKLLKEREDEFASQSVTWSVQGNIERTRVSPTQDIIAAGGKNNKLRLWDVETQKPIYSTRNLKNNFLNLAVENWDLDFAFFGQHTTTNPRPNSNGYMLATTTAGTHDLRIYDTRDGTRRPCMYKKIGEHVARSVCVSNDENYILCGDAAGKIHKFDFRNGLNLLGSMKGSCGSIRQIETHASLPMIASVSLDRHLRIHDIETRKVLKEVYLTQKLSDCLFSAVVPGEKAKTFLGKKVTVDQSTDDTKGPKTKKVDDEEEEEMWSMLASHESKSKATAKSAKVPTVTASSIKNEIKSEIKSEDVIDLGSDDEDMDLDFEAEGEDGSLFDFEECGEGEEGSMFGFEGVGEGEEQEDQLQGEGEFDFDPSMFNFGEGEDDFFDGEGEVDFDEDWDEDDDIQAFTSSFVILGPDGKPIPPKTPAVQAPVPSNNTKTVPKPSAALPSPVQEGQKRKAMEQQSQPQPAAVKKQRR